MRLSLALGPPFALLVLIAVGCSSTPAITLKSAPNIGAVKITVRPRVIPTPTLSMSHDGGRSTSFHCTLEGEGEDFRAPVLDGTWLSFKGPVQVRLDRVDGEDSVRLFVEGVAVADLATTVLRGTPHVLNTQGSLGYVGEDAGDHVFELSIQVQSTTHLIEFRAKP